MESFPTRLLWAQIPRDCLDIAATLQSGQAFRWHLAPGGNWYGAIGPHAVFLAPAVEGFWWQTWPDERRWDVLERYFALDVPLGSLYASWTASEPRMVPVVERWRGLRVLRQDPAETLFAFACACCNTVSKITRSVSALAERYGRPIARGDGRTVFEFPAPETICEASEPDLRSDLWGFRASRLVALAREVVSRGPAWFTRLRAMTYGEARSELIELPGIGPKIADCVCLFGLGHHDACPVDTHIRQVALRWYEREAAHGKSLGRAGYDRTADVIRLHLRPRAGWAQQYVFVDELARTRQN